MQRLRPEIALVHATYTLSVSICIALDPDPSVSPPLNDVPEESSVTPPPEPSDTLIPLSKDAPDAKFAADVDMNSSPLTVKPASKVARTPLRDVVVELKLARWSLVPALAYKSAPELILDPLSILLA